MTPAARLGCLSGGLAAGPSAGDAPRRRPPGSSVVPVTSAADGGVQLVRVEAPERVFDRDKVLGRDAASVFPSLAQTNADRVVSATQAVVGTMNFVTESELEEIKAKARGRAAPRGRHRGGAKTALGGASGGEGGEGGSLPAGVEDDQAGAEQAPGRGRGRVPRRRRRAGARGRAKASRPRPRRRRDVQAHARDDGGRESRGTMRRDLPPPPRRRRRQAPGGAIGAGRRRASAEPATKAAGKAAVAAARWRPVVRLEKRKKAEPESRGKEKDDAADAPPPSRRRETATREKRTPAAPPRRPARVRKRRQRRGCVIEAPRARGEGALSREVRTPVLSIGRSLSLFLARARFVAASLVSVSAPSRPLAPSARFLPSRRGGEPRQNRPFHAGVVAPVYEPFPQHAPSRPPAPRERPPPPTRTPRARGDALSLVPPPPDPPPCRVRVRVRVREKPRALELHHARSPS